MWIHDVKKEAIDMLKEVDSFIERVEDSQPIDRTEGQKLANKLRSHSISLGSSKAYEIAPLVGKTALAAAKLAYLIYGNDSEEMETYEREIINHNKLNEAYGGFNVGHHPLSY